MIVLLREGNGFVSLSVFCFSFFFIQKILASCWELGKELGVQEDLER